MGINSSTEYISSTDKMAHHALDRDAYKTLLESTRSIPWKLDWASKRFTYIGPQIETLLGWPQGSWDRFEDWSSRIHPEEREHVVHSCLSQSLAGLDHEADYRALTINNSYVWIRDVVRVVKNAEGEIESLIGVMLDITEHKRVEQEIAAMQRELERLSYKDALTGISNRRDFDIKLQAEWGDAQAMGHSISLILLDIDRFKQYNDAHGHLQGDHCLKTIGQALGDIVPSPPQVLARFGGEEFAILLPDTEGSEAALIAEKCRSALERAEIRHCINGRVTRVTASFGVGTIIPTKSVSALSFCDIVDRQLYRAKNLGRNRICSADEFVTL